MPRIRGVAILNNPALAATLPAAAQWLQPTFSFTGTSSNGAATVTSITSPYVPAQWSTTGPILAGTSTLLFGPGFPLAGTTVASVNSATQITAAVNATTALGAGTGVFTVMSVAPFQSSFAGNWPGYMQPNYASGDVVGALLEIPFAVTVASLYSASAFPLPPGDLLISVTGAATTATQLQAYLNSSWVQVHNFGLLLLPVTAYCPSDGANWRLLIPANVPTAISIYQFR